MHKIENIKPFCLRPQDNLRSALSVLNKQPPHLFILVVDESGKFLATVTDGDIRRGLLNGLDLESPLRDCMHGNPFTIKEGQPVPRKLLEDFGFVPEVNKDGQIRCIYIFSRQSNVIHNALIMAGGLGKRLHPHTLNTPKPLLPVAGRPLLARLLDKMDESNVAKTFVSVHYLADQFDEFLLKDKRAITEVSLVHEKEMLGTAGCLSLLKGKIDQPLLMTNGDILSSLNFASFANYHQDFGYDATLAVTLHEVTIPFGVIETDETGGFETITEKPTLMHMVAAGVYMVSPNVIELCEEGRVLDMPELLQKAKDHGLKVGIYPFHDYWRDVGRPEDLKDAKNDLRDGKV